MRILAMDTSNQALSVALLDEEQLIAEVTVNVKKNHSISLMPTIDFLVDSVGWKPSDIQRIVVAKGPGSYTGLRVAVATAKTLAYALGADLVGVSSLCSLAASVPAVGTVIPLIDARRNHAYAGFYEGEKALRSDAYYSFEEILAVAATFKQVTFTGEVAAFEEQIRSVLPEARIQSSLPSSQAIGRIGLTQTAEEVHTFEPAYLKKVEAEENWLKTREGLSDTASYIQRV